SGRAGRRGIDTEGFVVVPWSADASFAQLTALAKGRLPTLTSHFRPTPAMVATFARHGSAGELTQFARSSLRAHLAQRQATALRANLASLLDEAPAESDDVVEEPPPDAVTLAHIRPGDVIVDPGRRTTGVLAVVGALRQRRGVDAIDVVGEDSRRTTLTVRALRASPVVVGRIELPEAGPSPRGFTREVCDRLRAAPRASLLRAAATPAPKRRVRRDMQRTRAAISQLRRRIRFEETELDDELAAYVELLRVRGHLDVWVPTASGRALARLFHDAGLLVAECLREGLFTGLAAPELAAFASCFTPRGARAEHALRAPTPAVAAAYRAADTLVRDLNLAEESLGLAHSPSPNAAMAGVMFRWTATGDLARALQGSDVQAGDLVREARQVAELLEQIALVAVDEVSSTAAVTIAGLNRGIVIDELGVRA
ncbi:MAG TPA: hypothetical protein VMZ22_01010, partial [Acidimicrobiales bacterium]|nr:hypothetical protein [Acidimicrobiales bacterium]